MTIPVLRTKRRRLTRAEPDISATVLADGQDEIAGQAIFSGVVREFAVLIPAQPAAIRSIRAAASRLLWTIIPHVTIVTSFPSVTTLASPKGRQ